MIFGGQNRRECDMGGGGGGGVKAGGRCDIGGSSTIELVMIDVMLIINIITTKMVNCVVTMATGYMLNKYR